MKLSRIRITNAEGKTETRHVGFSYFPNEKKKQANKKKTTK